VLNLAINARDAIATGGRLVIETPHMRRSTPMRWRSCPALDAGEYVVLSVADTGSGMAPEVWARAFEPFFTTKGRPRGAVSAFDNLRLRPPVRRHVTIYSEPGRWTTVKPLSAQGLDLRRPCGKAGCPPVAHANRGETVLVVEDDDRVRRLTATASSNRL